MSKTMYTHGIKMIECKCGVWRIDGNLKCWSHEGRDKLTSEALAQFNQSISNLLYGLLKAFRLVK